MSARKLGRFVAGLFVALGLAFGGSLLATTGGSDAVARAADSSVGTITVQFEYDWS